MAWLVSGLGPAFLAYPAGNVGTHEIHEGMSPQTRTLAVIHNSTVAYHI